jgi:hypothetical protein
MAAREVKAREVEEQLKGMDAARKRGIQAGTGLFAH